jgi:tetratricopeptide (TPR) repeat protein
MNEPLVLRALEVASPGHWRWRLTEADGAVLADHEVHLDAAAWECAAFIDLDRYIELHTASNYLVAEEAALIEQVGKWAGEVALGETIGSALAARAPVTVRVLVPVDGEFFSTYPFEISYIDGQPLVRHGITLVFEHGGTGEQAPALTAERPVGNRLRMLALFSLPAGGSALGLRRERYELARLMAALRTRSRLAIELKVLQYGVTRERLAEEAMEDEGWDILHVSGHGKADTLVLELPDGSPDFVQTDDLVRMLIPARRRLKFAVLSSCDSGAATVAETLHWLGLDGQAATENPPLGTRSGADNNIQATSGLARALADRLGIAVLGMRYPVQDEFAIAVAAELYPAILENSQPVDTAANLAITAAAGPRPTVGRPPLSICTPALFGPAVGLKLSSPRGRPGLDEPEMVGFPPEPERFVGRTRAILAGNAALASDSGRAAVVFHGMAGIGKTSCALELVYQHRGRFEAMVWWRAPEQDAEADQIMTSFAFTLETRLEDYGLAMLDSANSLAGIDSLLPDFITLLRERRILLVLDNVETLLTAQGSWRDPRWGRLFDALTSHGGLSRLILTTRVIPAATPSGRVLVEAVHPLSLEETVLLARELPNLRVLLNVESGPGRAGTGQTVADRDLALRTLQVVQGHPKLLELADAAAADPHDLAARLDATQTELADRGQALDVFFATGLTALESKDILTALGAWTTDTFVSLPVAARLLVGLLACIQEGDRISIVLEWAWPVLWHILPDYLVGENGAEDGENGAPPLSEALSPLIATALVQVGDSEDGNLRSPVHYRIHPAIADTVRVNAPQLLIDAANQVMAQAWYESFLHALHGEPRDEEWMVHAGMSAAPYLLQCEEWNALGMVLQHVIMGDVPEGITRHALSYFNSAGPGDDTKDAMRWQIVHGKVLASVDRGEAERYQRGVLDKLLAKGWYELAWVTAGDLMQLYRGLGRMADALAMAKERKALSERAGLGSWVQVSDEADELRLNFAKGNDANLRERAENLIARIDSLPVRDEDGLIDPRGVSEGVLALGLRAALAAEDWRRALELNQQILDSHIRRGAGELAQAYVMINDYGPLMRLGRLTEALDLLIECQRIFIENDEIDAVGDTFAARANVESAMNRPIEAIRHIRAALGYLYSGPIVQLKFSSIASCHYNLGHMLTTAGKDERDDFDGIAHLLAAAFINAQIGNEEDMRNAVLMLVHVLKDPGSPVPPESFDVVSQTVQQVPGVRFQELLEAMLPNPGEREQVLGELISAIRQLRDASH